MLQAYNQPTSQTSSSLESGLWSARSAAGHIWNQCPWNRVVLEWQVLELGLNCSPDATPILREILVTRNPCCTELWNRDTPKASHLAPSVPNPIPSTQPQLFSSSLRPPICTTPTLQLKLHLILQLVPLQTVQLTTAANSAAESASESAAGTLQEC